MATCIPTLEINMAVSHKIINKFTTYPSMWDTMKAENSQQNKLK